MILSFNILKGRLSMKLSIKNTCVVLSLALVVCGFSACKKPIGLGNNQSGTDNTETEKSVSVTETVLLEETVIETVATVTETEAYPTVERVKATPHVAHTIENNTVDKYPYYPPCRTLMYHLIMEEPYNPNSEALFVRPSEFDDHLTAFNNAGLEYKFAFEYGNATPNSVFITFDDGYEDNYTTMFPILKQHNAKATIFLVSDLIDTDGYLKSEQIKEMVASGLVYFGCHAKTHSPLSKMNTETTRNEFATSIAKIEALTNEYCTVIAYPGGDYSALTIEVAHEYFDYGFIARPSVTHDYNEFYTLPRIYAARGMTGAALVARLG